MLTIEADSATNSSVVKYVAVIIKELCPPPKSGEGTITQAY